MSLQIRSATPADSAACLEIYRPYILDTPYTFEIEVPTKAEFQSRIEERLGIYPWLVAEKDDKVIGYAYAGQFRLRPAYAWTLESTVYLHPDQRGRGVGTALYRKLLAELKEQGVVNVIGGITLPNEGSVQLHESLGFRQVAHIPDAGFKQGRWWDIGYWQLQFDKPLHPEKLRGTFRQV